MNWDCWAKIFSADQPYLGLMARLCASPGRPCPNGDGGEVSGEGVGESQRERTLWLVSKINEKTCFKKKKKKNILRLESYKSRKKRSSLGKY